MISLLTIVSLSTNAATQVKQSVPSSKNTSELTHKIRSHNPSNIVWLDSTITHSALDEDNDSYSQDISFIFDFDTSYTSLPVYIEILLLDEYDNVTRLTTSDVFTLHTDSLSDKQRFDVTVDERLASGYYRFTVNVYDAKNKQLLNHIDYHSHEALQNIRLEGHKYDHHDTFSLFSHHETLLTDNDHDGYFQRIVINLDIDSIYDNHQLYAKFTLDGRELYQSRVFAINGSSTSDNQSFDLLIPATFEAGSYQLSVTINELDRPNANYHSVAHQLAIVPLESSFDDEAIPPDIIVHEGGSFGWVILCILGIAGLRNQALYKNSL